MTVVLTQSPIRDFYFTPRRNAALGLDLLKRELEDQGHRVSLMNFASGTSATLRLPRDLAYLEPFFVPAETGPLTWFNTFRRFGVPFVQAAEGLLAQNPDAVFLTCFAWAYAEDTLELAREIRTRSPAIPLIVGGAGATVHPETFLEAVSPERGDPVFSLVVAGEAEGRIPLIHQALNTGDAFLDLRKHPPIHQILPAVAPVAGRFAGRRWYAAMLTRGCPCACAFCANHLTSGRGFRPAPEDSWAPVVMESFAADGVGDDPIHLNIEDDAILVSKEAFFAFLEDLRRRHPRISFTAENGLDYRFLNPVDLDRLVDVGFSALHLSLGTASSASAGTVHRSVNPAGLEALLRHAGELKLPVTTHFICGLKDDRRQDIAETLRFLGRLPTRIGISPFYPVPGLPGFEDPEVFQGISPRLALGSAVYPWTGSLSTSTMISAFRLARWMNYRRSKLDGIKSSPEEARLYQLISETRQLHTLVKRPGSKTPIALENLDDRLIREVLE